MFVIDKYAKYEQRHYVSEYHSYNDGWLYNLYQDFRQFNMGSLSKKYKEHVSCHK